MTTLYDAYTYIGVFYNKILLVNLNHNSFTPIKLDRTELNSIPQSISFTQWVEDFIHSPYFNPNGENRHLYDFSKYYNIEYLRHIKNPLMLEYQKLIKGEYHDMETVFLPVGDGYAYIYVRDNTRIINSSPE